MAKKGVAKLTFDQIKERTEAYFKKCMDDQFTVVISKRTATLPRPYTIVGLCLALDITKQTLYEWRGGKYADEATKTQVANYLTRACLIIEEDTVSKSMLGLVDPRISSLVLAGMGYASKQESTVQATVTWEGVKPDDISKYSA